MQILKQTIRYVVLNPFIRKVYTKIVPKSLRDKIRYVLLGAFSKKINLILAFDKKRLLRFEVNITDHCNLNCRGCDAFAPITDKYFLDPSDFEKDCARIAELTGGNLEYVRLVGGEPLLHSRCTDFFTIVRKYFKNTCLSIWTNGLILAKQSEDFWKAAKENNVELIITIYPVKVDYSQLEQIAQTYHVKISYAGDREEGMFKKPFDLEGKQDCKENFTLCKTEMDCITLKDGKLFVCEPITKIPIFNKYFKQNLEVTENDYIDIYKAKKLDEILTNLYQPKPFCRYCNIKKTVRGLDWGTSKKEISEWT